MRVLKKIFFYLVLVLLFTSVIRFLVYEGITRNESGLFDKFNKIFEQRNSYSALFVGSSRAECHFDPRVFDSITGLNSYNIGVSGSNNSFTFGILKSYLNKSEAPEYLIMNIDFHFAHESSDTIYEFPRFFPYLDNEILFHELQKRDKRFLLFKYFPPYSLAFIGDKYLNVCLRGYFNKPSPYDEQCYKGFQSINPLNYKDIDKEESAPYQGSVLKENRDYLDSIVNLAKQKGSKVYFVVSPTYFKGTERIRNYSNLILQFEDIAKKNDLPFLNYNQDTLSLQKQYFADFYHMKRQGAEVFTRKFALDFRDRFLK